MLTTDDAWIKHIIQASAGSHGTFWALNHHPVARVDATAGGGGRMQLHLGVRSATPQGRQPPMLGLAKLGVLGARQYERKPNCEVRSRPRAYQRLVVLGNRWIAVGKKRL